jgi:hypothetical protein
MSILFADPAVTNRIDHIIHFCFLHYLRSPRLKDERDDIDGVCFYNYDANNIYLKRCSKIRICDKFGKVVNLGDGSCRAARGS